MAKIVLTDFNGGLCRGWFNFSGNSSPARYVDKTQHMSGLVNPFYEDAYGYLVPGHTTFTSVTGEGGLNTSRIVTGCSLDDNNSNVDSTSGTSFYFGQDNKLFALDPTSDTIESTGGFPYTLTHGAHSSLVIDRIIAFGADGSIPTLHVIGRDATDAFAGMFDKTTGYSEDGIAGDTTNWTSCGFNKSSKIIACAADNTRMYLAQDNKIHMFDGRAAAANSLFPNQVVLEKTAKIVDMVDAYGKLWILKTRYNLKALGSGDLNTMSTARPSSVLIWNRSDSQVAIEDNIVLEDCNDASYIHSANGTIYVFVNGGNRVNQLRVFDGRKFVTVADLGENISGVPACKDAITSFNGGIMWQDIDGKLFWFGKPQGADKEALFNVGKRTDAVAASGGMLLNKGSGVLYAAHKVGSLVKLAKWDSQLSSGATDGNRISFGNIDLPKLSTINGITFFIQQLTGGGDTTTQLVEIFDGKLTGTAGANLNIDTDVDIPRGYVYFPLSLDGVNILSLAFSPLSTTVLAYPKIYRIEIDYTPTSKLK